MSEKPKIAELGLIEWGRDGVCKTFENFHIGHDGGIHRTSLPVNAVLVQILPAVDYDGNPTIQHVVSTIVTDPEMTEDVRKEALRILRALSTTSS